VVAGLNVTGWVDLAGHFSNLGTSLKVLVKSRLRMLRGEMRRSGEPQITDFRGPNVRNLKVSQTRLPPDRVADLLAEYTAGTPVKVLAKRYGIARQTVSEHARRAGVLHTRVEFTDEMLARVIAMCESGMSLQRIADELPVGSKRVREALAGAGVEIRARKGGRPRLFAPPRPVPCGLPGRL
jgi:uncharacterized protein (DUF433 family)